MNQKLETTNSSLNESLALPVYPELSDSQAKYVVDTLAGFYGKRRE
jgi:dTDP-4-amino-4,6-dideoxygalactose transaminase